jgi:uncharacterized protein YecE (DUF72 family)
MAKRPTTVDPAQLDLFAEEPCPDAAVANLEREYAAAEAIAARLPSEIRFGTSSWSFPGWQGLVYARARSTQALARDGLAEYARHPLLRTVGIDRGFYAPIPESDLRRYAGQLPPDFRCCAKAPVAVTSPVRIGAGAGAGRGPEVNPDYLDPGRFRAEMVEPFLRSFGGHCGPFVLQFPPHPPGHRPRPAEFAERLDRFLAGLPSEALYAVELREPQLLTPMYRDVLSRHGAGHVYNYATAMPLPGAQAEVVPLEVAPFTVIRLLLRPGTRYAERREEFAPFDRLVDPDEAMRTDVLDLIRRASATRRPSFILVNNKAEGSAPLTIRALAEILARG